MAQCALKILLLCPVHFKGLDGQLARHEVHYLKDGENILVKLMEGTYDLVIIDGGMELVRDIVAIDPRVDIFLVGRNESEALEVIRHGASECFSLPVDAEKFTRSLAAVCEQVAIRDETDDLENQLVRKYTFAGVVARNPLMLDCFRFLRKIAPYFRTVTITGETGTGKEAVARALHSISPMAASPFVPCNCGGLVENLVESEFFGHVRGAFTGADADKKGLFEAAGDGILFLDEIGDLPLSFQPHLLRVLQTWEFRKIGSPKTLKASCRVVAATNKDLAREVKEGRFREDLYYRLTPLTLTVPPLRERKDDIPLLGRFIVQRFTERTGKNMYGISRPAQKALLSYDWPGNVRELENAVEHAAILASEPYLKPEHLPHTVTASNARSGSPARLEDLIMEHITATLKSCGGNRSEAAKVLGISRRSLLRRLEKYSID